MFINDWSLNTTYFPLISYCDVINKSIADVDIGVAIV